MKTRSIVSVAVALLAICWLDTPKAHAYRGFGGFYRGGFGFRGGFVRPWFRPWGVGFARPWVRPWVGRPWVIGINRPWFRPWFVYRPWWNRPFVVAGNYQSGYAPAPYYGDYYDGYYPPSNGNYISPPPSSYPPMMPRGDGTFLYNGGPRSLVPVPIPAQPLRDNFISTQAKASGSRFPAYGEPAQPTTASTTPVQAINYPAYGERPSAPATLVSNNKR